MIREPVPPSAEETVAATVSEFAGLAKRGALLIGGCAAAAMLLAGAFLATQTPTYRASAQLLVDPQALQVVGKDIVRNDTAASIDFANIDSQALVMTSNSVLEQLVQELDLGNDPAFKAAGGRLSRLLGSPPPQQTLSATLDNLRKAVVARRVDNSLVFELTVSHPDAERSALIANRLASIYLRQGTEGRGAAVKRAGDTLLGQLTNLRNQLSAAETAVERYRGDNNLISTGEAGLIVNQQLKELYTGITAAETDLARLAAKRDQLAKLGPDALLSDRIPEALNSPTITALRAQFAQTSREAARLAETLLPRHPRLMEARGELQAARRSLADELDRIRASIVDEYAQAKGNLDKLKERAASLTKSQVSSSEQEIRLRQLESEAEAVRAVYNSSLARAKELEQQEKIETSNSRLISAASVPAKPTKAPAVIVLPAAAVFGACLGLAIIFLKELLRGVAPDTRSVARMFGVSTFATLRRRDGGAGIDPTDGAGLIAVARRVQDSVGTRSPAIAMLAGANDLDGAVRRGVVAALGRSLAGLGESVWICLQNDHGEPVHVERMRPSRIVDMDQTPAGGALTQATMRAQSLQVLEALHQRASRRGEGSEMLLLSDDHTSGLAASAGGADAIVLVFELGRTRRRTLRDLAALVDPSGDRIAAVIGVEAAHKARLPRALPSPKLSMPFARRSRQAAA